MNFRTRRKDGVIFPLSNGKVYQKQDDYEQEEKKKAQEMRRLEKPSFTTRYDAKSDVKKLMRADDSKLDKQKEFETYKKKLDRDMQLTYIKEDKRADKRREKAQKKEEKLEEKSQQISGDCN
jgi:hypothetical protein